MSELRLNLGCGIKAPPNWVNIDSSLRVWLDKIPLLPVLTGYQRRFPPWVRRFDVRRPLAFADKSAQYVYSSHLIEHLTRREAEKLLKECARVLVPGGRIRILTPNLRFFAENYLGRRSDPVLRKDAADHFVRWLGVFSDRYEGAFDQKIVHMWQRKNLHHWLYDEHSVVALLGGCGFLNVVARDNWISDFPDLDQLESVSLRPGSVCAEGTKG